MGGKGSAQGAIGRVAGEMLEGEEVIYKRCDNPPCHELAPYPDPYCCTRCKKNHQSRLYHLRHFGPTRQEKVVRKQRKKVMTDAEQEQINLTATRAMAARMKQPLDKMAARRYGALW